MNEVGKCDFRFDWFDAEMKKEERRKKLRIKPSLVCEWCALANCQHLPNQMKIDQFNLYNWVIQ